MDTLHNQMYRSGNLIVVEFYTRHKISGIVGFSKIVKFYKHFWTGSVLGLEPKEKTWIRAEKWRQKQINLKNIR